MEAKVRFTWNMLYDCNYRCSYCFFEGKWEEYSKRTMYLSPEEWMGYWKIIYDEHGPFYLVITGGEPFIYPNFIEIIKKLSQICYHINISSNSSGDLKRFVEEIDHQKVSLSLSYQPGFDKLEEFIERLLFIREHKFNGCINLVAYPPFLKDLARYKEKFASINEFLKIIPFFGEYQGITYPKGYTPEEQKLIGIDEGWFQKVRMKGSICAAGQKTALLFPDGKAARCGQIGEDKILGNFFDKTFKLLDNPLPCEAEYCPCDEGAVIPKDNFLKSPKEDVEYKIKSQSSPESLKPEKNISFTWDIHYKCNFRCPYCWFYKKWADLSSLNLYLAPDEWMVHWKRLYEKYGRIRIEIVGGEPTIYPDFVSLVKKLSTLHSVKITTNLSTDIDSFVKEINPEKVDLDLNLHTLFIDEETFLKKVLVLKKAGFQAGVCYLAYPPQMYKIKKLSEKFKKEDINFALAAFWGEYNGKKYPQAYTPAETDLIRPFLGDIDRVIYHLNAERTKGKLCNAGYRYAVVRADGKVVRCGQLSERIIGNILDEQFTLLDHPVPCEADFCPCNEYDKLID